MAPRIAYDLTQKTGTQMYHETQNPAFLYYYMSPENPRITGELRLRVASLSFSRGPLAKLRTNGRLWSRPVYPLSKYYISSVWKN